jgi:hypothetical protein
MTIKVGDMIGYAYRKENGDGSRQKPKIVVALIVHWNGNLDRPALCITTSLERHWPILDPATFFGNWVGVYPVGAVNQDGAVVLTPEHAAICRKAIETHLATKHGSELLQVRMKKHDALIVPSEGCGRLEDYEVPLQPFPGKGSFASPQMDIYLGRGWAYRRWLQSWSDRQPASYDMFLESAHHKERGGVGIIDPAEIHAA